MRLAGPRTAPTQAPRDTCRLLLNMLYRGEDFAFPIGQSDLLSRLDIGPILHEQGNSRQRLVENQGVLGTGVVRPELQFGNLADASGPLSSAQIVMPEIVGHIRLAPSFVSSLNHSFPVVPRCGGEQCFAPKGGRMRYCPRSLRYSRSTSTTGCRTVVR